MKKIVFLILFMVLATPAIAKQKQVYNNKAQQNLAKQYALAEGKVLAKRLGKQWEKTVYAVVQQETAFGAIGKIGDRGTSLGLGQMKIQTAKTVCNYFGIPFNAAKMKKRLLTDDKFAIHMTALYLEYLHYHYKYNFDETIVAYNVGPVSVNKYGKWRDPQDYLRKVKRHISNV